MAQSIELARLSLISVETLPPLLEQNIDPAAQLHSIAPGSSYTQLFDHARAGNAPLNLRAPWPSPRGQLFWTHYLGREPGGTGGKQAWNALVPLRLAPCADIALKPAGTKCLAEGFYFPYGMAFVLTVTIENSGTLEQTVELGYRLRHDKEYSLTLSGQAAVDCKYDQLASKVLSYLRTIAFGPNMPAGQTSEGPFTVFTVIQASGINPATTVTADSDLHKDLDGATRWRPFHRQVAPADLADSSIDIMTSPASHVLYATKRGRAIWFPNYFSASQEKATLSCYHRNVVLASMLADSQTGVLKIAQPLCKANAALPSHMRECAKKATSRLTLAYLGKTTTYRSASIKEQIDDNGYLPVIDVCRNYFHMDPPLTPPAAPTPPQPPAAPQNPAGNQPQNPQGGQPADPNAN